MKIISKYNDYYDSVQAYGSDPKTIYVRKEKTIDDKEHAILNTLWNNSEEILFDLNFIGEQYKNICFENLYFVFFCAKIFPCFEISVPKNPPNPGINAKEYRYCYNINDIDKIIYKYGTKKHLKEYNNKLTKNEKRSYIWGKPKNRKSLIQLINKFAKIPGNKIFELHHKFGTPCFYFSSSKYNAWNKKTNIVLNPVLKDIEFYKVFDSYRAFQEISMFISGIMGGKSPPTIEISDKIRKEKHGFDKWSFRKESTKGK